MELKTKIYFCPKCKRRIGIPKMFLGENVKNFSASKIKITCNQPLPNKRQTKKCDGYIHLKFDNTKSQVTAVENSVEAEPIQNETVLSEQIIEPNKKEHENIS